jgi:hypothetical protein
MKKENWCKQARRCEKGRDSIYCICTTNEPNEHGIWRVIESKGFTCLWIRCKAQFDCPVKAGFYKHVTHWIGVIFAYMVVMNEEWKVNFQQGRGVSYA